MSKKDSGTRPQSKAAITIDVQNANREIGEGIIDICARAESLLDTQAPTKRQKRNLLDTVESLLQLQTSVAEKNPDLVPSDCSRYSLSRLQTSTDYSKMTCENQTAPRPNMRQRYFVVGNISIPLPDNRKQYTAMEACNILSSVELDIKKRN